jgi:DNA-binding MarR family transcriptional regulator
MSDTAAVTAWEALFRAQVAVMRRLAADFPDGDIALSDYDVLFTLSRAPEHSLRMRDLGESILLSQPSVSRLVDRLAARGLVAKRPDPDDGRGVIAELTDAGEAAFRRAAVQHMRSISARVGGVLDDAELARLTELCDKLRLGSPRDT